MPVSGTPAKVLIQCFGEAFLGGLFFTLVLLHILYIFLQFFLPLLSAVARGRGPPFFLVKIFFRNKDLFLDDLPKSGYSTPLNFSLAMSLSLLIRLEETKRPRWTSG